MSTFEYPPYGDAAGRFKRENAVASEVAEERRQAGLARQRELVNARKDLRTQLDEITRELEGLVDELGEEAVEKPAKHQEAN